jgi:hypothetical protein
MELPTAYRNPLQSKHLAQTTVLPGPGTSGLLEKLHVTHGNEMSDSITPLVCGLLAV